MSKAKTSKTKYISKGLYRSVSRSTLNAMKADRSPADVLLNKQRAWIRGSNPWVTVDNPNREETNKRFIRVRMNDLMKGTAKDREKRMHVMK